MILKKLIIKSKQHISKMARGLAIAGDKKCRFRQKCEKNNKNKT